MTSPLLVLFAAPCGAAWSRAMQATVSCPPSACWGGGWGIVIAMLLASDRLLLQPGKSAIWRRRYYLFRLQAPLAHPTVWPWQLVGHCGRHSMEIFCYERALCRPLEGPRPPPRGVPGGKGDRRQGAWLRRQSRPTERISDASVNHVGVSVLRAQSLGMLTTKGHTPPLSSSLGTCRGRSVPVPSPSEAVMLVDADPACRHSSVMIEKFAVMRGVVRANFSIRIALASL